MTAICNACGETWPRDPALEVPCPTCFVGTGRRCRRPSGHGCEIHADRDQAALDAGLIRPCPAARRPALECHQLPIAADPAQGVLL